MKIYFKDLTGYSGSATLMSRFIADRVCWCEINIGKRYRDSFSTREQWGWDTIKRTETTYRLLPALPIGIEIDKEEDAAAFLLMFK
jgi:hypothetical protein